MTSGAQVSQAPTVSFDEQPAELPWLALTSPVSLWQRLEQQQALWPGLLAQFLILTTAAWIAAPAYAELDRIVLGVSVNPIQPARLVAIAVSVAISVVIGNTLLSAILFATTGLLGLKTSFKSVLAVLAYALLPLMLGQALGKCILALAAPLAQTPAEVLAWHLRPFSFGLNILLVNPPPVLTLQWVFYSCFDLFCIWTLLLSCSGLSRATSANRGQAVWLLMAMVLVFSAGAIAVWQIGQAWLASL